jgi:hypothetical protein
MERSQESVVVVIEGLALRSRPHQPCQAGYAAPPVPRTETQGPGAGGVHFFRRVEEKPAVVGVQGFCSDRRRMPYARWSIGLALLAAAATAPAPRAATHPPFAFLAPAAAVDDLDRARLDAGRVVVKVLPASGRELAVVAAVRVTTTPEQLLDWGLRVERMQGRYISAVGRFSDPPRPEDVRALALGEGDLQDLRRCRPGDCGLKLNAADIATVRQSLAAAAHWKDGLQRGFRDAVVARARAALADGDAGAEDPPWLDQSEVVESFLYWSTETFGFKPITSITHRTVLRPRTPGGPAALVVSRQVFATHYKDAALGMTALTGSAEDGWYLVYVHRSQLDVLEGLFGGLVRRVIERRVRDEAPELLLALRRTLEEGAR